MDNEIFVFSYFNDLMLIFLVNPQCMRVHGDCLFVLKRFSDRGFTVTIVSSTDFTLRALKGQPSLKFLTFISRFGFPFYLLYITDDQASRYTNCENFYFPFHV